MLIPTNTTSKLLSALCLSVISAAAHAGLLDKTNNRGGFLPVEQAFVLDALALDREHIEARWLIAPGYYLYKHRLAVAADGAQSLQWQAPGGQPYHDEHFGDVEIYRETLSLPLEIEAGSGDSVTLRIEYQGCADAGLCYPPVKRELTVDLPER